MKIEKRSTVYVKFNGGEMPRRFELKNENDELYYFRFLDGKTSRIKFNVLHPGQYVGNVPFEVVKIVPVELPSPSQLPALPPYERDRIKDFKIIYNSQLLGTPARNFTNKGIIEKGVNFYNYSKPLRVFFLLHEIAHFYYETEEKCDLFALVHYLQMGYNRSMAMYALTRVLHPTQNNLNRSKHLFSQIKKTNNQKL